MQADIFTQIILPLSLFLIMLGMGLALKVSDFLRVLQAPKAFAIGFLCQILLLARELRLAITYIASITGAGRKNCSQAHA